MTSTNNKTKYAHLVEHTCTEIEESYVLICFAIN